MPDRHNELKEEKKKTYKGEEQTIYKGTTNHKGTQIKTTMKSQHCVSVNKDLQNDTTSLASLEQNWFYHYWNCPYVFIIKALENLACSLHLILASRFRKDIDKEKTQDSVGNFVVEGRRGNSPIEEMGKLGGLL